jgi:hypothetical protein
MIYRGYEIRESAAGFEATDVEEGWDCDWEWICTAKTLDGIKKVIDSQYES